MTPKKKESFELSKEDKEIIQETKIHEKREQLPQKTGVVLTGGIDSSVTLCKVKRLPGSMDIQPIVFNDPEADTNNIDVIRSILTHEGLSDDIKEFGKVTTKGGKKCPNCTAILIPRPRLQDDHVEYHCQRCSYILVK